MIERERERERNDDDDDQEQLSGNVILTRVGLCFAPNINQSDGRSTGGQTVVHKSIEINESMAKAFDKSINICSPQPVFSLFSAGRMDVRTKGSEIGSRERESRPSKTPSTPVNGSKTHTQSCLLMLCWPAGLFSRLASNQVERPTLSLCGGRRLASAFPVDKSTPLSVSIAVVGVDVDK